MPRFTDKENRMPSFNKEDLADAEDLTSTTAATVPGTFARLGERVDPARRPYTNEEQLANLRRLVDLLAARLGDQQLAGMTTIELAREYKDTLQHLAKVEGSRFREAEEAKKKQFKFEHDQAKEMRERLDWFARGGDGWLGDGEGEGEGLSKVEPEPPADLHRDRLQGVYEAAMNAGHHAIALDAARELRIEDAMARARREAQQ